MSTYVVNVPAGTQSLVQTVTPLTNVCAAPAVLGGTVLVESAPSPGGPWTAWSYGTSGAGGSLRLSQNGYVRCTSATQAGTLVLTDMSGVNSPNTTSTLISANGVMASPSSTAAQILYSFRIPPTFLTPNFRMEMAGSLNLSNNANVKTLTVAVQGTTVATMAVTSFAAFNFCAYIFGFDGLNVKGSIGSATGGVGGSTTAITTSTLARDYLNNETEVTVSITKATGTDTAELHSLAVRLLQ